MAVAFVVLAAIPAVADGADASVTKDTSAFPDTALEIKDYNKLKDTLMPSTGDAKAAYIKLAGNITVPAADVIVITSNVKIDLNGYSITKTVDNLTSDGDKTNDLTIFDMGSTRVAKDGKALSTGNTLSIMDSSKDKNGKIALEMNFAEGAKNSDYAQGVIDVFNQDTLELQDVAVESGSYGIYAGESATVTVTNAKINSWAPAISGNGNNKDAVLTIHGGSYTSEGSVAIFFPSTKTLIVDQNATFTGIGGFDIRNANVKISDATITISGTATGVGSSGPADLNVGIGIYQWAGYPNASGAIVGDTSYGTPQVTIKNVTVTAADGTTKACDVYFGSLTGGTSNAPKSFKDATAVSADTKGMRTGAALTILDENGEELYKIDEQSNTEGYASSVKIDLTADNKLKILKGSVLNCEITAGGSDKVRFEQIKAKDALTIGKGSIIIEGDYEKNNDTNRFVIKGNAKISGTVEAGVTLVIENGALAVVEDGKSLTVKGTLNIASGGTLINNGSLDASAAVTQSISGSIVSNDGAKTKLKGESDKVIGNYTVGTETKEGSDNPLTVASIEDLYYSIANGVKKVTLNLTTGTNLELDCDKGTKYGVEVTVRTTNIVDLKVTGKISGNLTFFANGKLTFIDTTTVNNGVVLNVGDATVAAGAVFNLYGSINPHSNATITVGDDATFKAFSGAQIGQAVEIIKDTTAPAKGTGKIDLSQAQGPQTVGEDISADKTYGQLENVTVVGSLTIKNNSTVTILGGFQVNEGVTLTIEKGSELIIRSSSAAMNIAGRIIVEEGGYLTVDDANEVVVSGSIESEGTVSIDSNVTVKSGGEILIKDGSDSSFTAGEQLTIESGASLIIKADVDETTVSNKGTVTLDGAVLGGAFTIKMLADGAVADIQSVSGNNLVTISDEGLKFTNKDVPAVETADANKIKFTPGTDTTVKGLTVVEKVSSYVDNGTTYYTNAMDIAGSVSVSKESGDASATVAISGKNLAVTGALALGKNVMMAMTGADSVLGVSGTITATETGVEIASAGNIYVSGLIQTVKKIDTGINAAMYETKSGTTPIYNYSTLNAAVDSGVKDISVLGEISVTETLTVPAGVTVKNNGTIIVGSDDSTDVSLTFADGASVRYGTVDVKGTLVFDNKKDNKANEIRSDVSVIGDVSAKYTNLYTALSEAQAGDTVTITRDGTVDIKKNLTIKDGVTLDVPNSKRISIADGVTLTVAGTLKTAEAVGAQTAFAEKASLRAPVASAIAVTGTFMSMAAVEYSNYAIAGAYYSLTDSVGAYNYVTTVENAAKVAASAAGGEIAINGKVTAGDIAFTGTDAQTVYVYVMPGSVFTATSVTLDKAEFTTVVSGSSIECGVFTGRIAVGDSAVDAKNVFISAGADDEGQMGVFVQKTFEGMVAAYNNRNSDSTFAVSAGKVVVDAQIKVTVASGATLVSYDEFVSEIYGDLQINGSVAVGSDETIRVFGNVIVNGVLSVAEETDTEKAGSFEVDGVMYIGVTKKATTGEAVSVSGPVAVSDYVVAAADADISESTIDSFKNADGKLMSTTYSVEKKDWIVVYDLAGTTKIRVITEAPVENAEFDSEWKNSEGKDANDKNIGESKFEKVEAVVDYEIYTIYVNPAAGVESIAVDGNLMIKDPTTGLYLMVVKAGAHEITCKLANGYSGEPQFSFVKSVAVDEFGNSNDGEFNASVSGNKVTVSGDRGNVLIQITGIEKSGYVDPSPDMPAAEKDDGLTITDYLLIVLVVLIVIMAVIVAMRLMRS